MNHFEIDYPGCDILVFRDKDSTGRSINAVVMSNGELDWNNESTWGGMIDRSPCGTGTSAVMALLHSRGELTKDEEFHHFSIMGRCMHESLKRSTNHVVTYTNPNFFFSLTP